ncbi:MAG: integrase arm-type DNA-binding domain-containing protein [Acidobacteria bacterium]|nr:integrase arm-type DNA-binding domain-containing protein [Acidobacteriota bacterium]
MPTKRLTQEIAERAKPGELLCDTKVTGLMLISRARMKTWVAQREVKDAETGIRKTARVTLGHFPEMSLDDARLAAMEELQKMLKGQNPHEARNVKLTVAAAFEEYMTGAVDLQPKTKHDYRYIMEHYLKTVKDVPISDLGEKPQRVRQLFLNLTNTAGKATANGTLRVLRAVYNGSRELHSTLPPNPVRKGVIRWHKIQKRKTRIQEEQFTTWASALKTIQNPIRRGLRLFLLLSGQRDRATREMRWEHVNLDKETVFFPRPKGGELRAFTLPLSPQLVSVLRYLRTFSKEEWAFPGSEWVFPAHSESGHVMESKEQRKSKVLLNPHSLRRTFISCGYEVVPNKYVSYIANHACKDTITDEYFEPTLESLKKHLTTIGDHIVDKLKVDLDGLLGPAKFTYGQTKPTAESAAEVATNLTPIAESRL